jgi:DNA-binding XRE family transcriptional regulator
LTPVDVIRNELSDSILPAAARRPNRGMNPSSVLWPDLPETDKPILRSLSRILRGEILDKPRSPVHGDTEVFALNLKTLRQAKGMSQEELAHRADIDRTYISSLERSIYNASIDVAMVYLTNPLNKI